MVGIRNVPAGRRVRMPVHQPLNVSRQRTPIFHQLNSPGSVWSVPDSRATDERAWRCTKGVTTAREAKINSSLVYCMITTSRESARRFSLIAAISPAPPGIVPRNAVTTSRRVRRDRIQPLKRLVKSMKTTAKAKTEKCFGNANSVAGEKPAPKAVPITACAAMYIGRGSSTVCQLQTAKTAEATNGPKSHAAGRCAACSIHANRTAAMSSRAGQHDRFLKAPECQPPALPGLIEPGQSAARSAEWQRDNYSH